ncbi:unnamed protein product [Amoebophrya sp. A120]|nr:unnamed protein product [Amoebophrya sp. A120]|eukprot:GSA120T00015831001.1
MADTMSPPPGRRQARRNMLGYFSPAVLLHLGFFFPLLVDSNISTTETNTVTPSTGASFSADIELVSTAPSDATQPQQLLTTSSSYFKVAFSKPSNEVLFLKPLQHCSPWGCGSRATVGLNFGIFDSEGNAGSYEDNAMMNYAGAGGGSISASGMTSSCFMLPIDPDDLVMEVEETTPANDKARQTPENKDQQQAATSTTATTTSKEVVTSTTSKPDPTYARKIYTVVYCSSSTSQDGTSSTSWFGSAAAASTSSTGTGGADATTAAQHHSKTALKPQLLDRGVAIYETSVSSTTSRTTEGNAEIDFEQTSRFLDEAACKTLFPKIKDEECAAAMETKETVAVVKAAGKLGYLTKTDNGSGPISSRQTGTAAGTTANKNAKDQEDQVISVRSRLQDELGLFAMMKAVVFYEEDLVNGNGKNIFHQPIRLSHPCFTIGSSSAGSMQMNTGVGSSAASAISFPKCSVNDEICTNFGDTEISTDEQDEIFTSLKTVSDATNGLTSSSPGVAIASSITCSPKTFAEALIAAFWTLREDLTVLPYEEEHGATSSDKESLSKEKTTAAPNSAQHANLSDLYGQKLGAFLLQPVLPPKDDHSGTKAKTATTTSAIDDDETAANSDVYQNENVETLFGTLKETDYVQQVLSIHASDVSILPANFLPQPAVSGGTTATTFSNSPASAAFDVGVQNSDTWTEIFAAQEGSDSSTSTQPVTTTQISEFLKPNHQTLFIKLQVQRKNPLDGTRLQTSYLPGATKIDPNKEVEETTNTETTTVSTNPYVRLLGEKLHKHHPLANNLVPDANDITQSHQQVSEEETKKGPIVVDTDSVFLPPERTKKKVVILYFAYTGCPCCQRFTPQLAEWYNDGLLKDTEIVFVAHDSKWEDGVSYWNLKMPWYMLPRNGIDGKKFTTEGEYFKLVEKPLRKFPCTDLQQNNECPVQIKRYPTLLMIDAKTGQFIRKYVGDGTTLNNILDYIPEDDEKPITTTTAVPVNSMKKPFPQFNAKEAIKRQETEVMLYIKDHKTDFVPIELRQLGVKSSLFADKEERRQFNGAFPWTSLIPDTKFEVRDAREYFISKDQCDDEGFVTRLQKILHASMQTFFKTPRSDEVECFVVFSFDEFGTKQNGNEMVDFCTNVIAKGLLRRTVAKILVTAYFLPNHQGFANFRIRDARSKLALPVVLADTAASSAAAAGNKKSGSSTTSTAPEAAAATTSATITTTGAVVIEKKEEQEKHDQSEELLANVFPSVYLSRRTRATRKITENLEKTARFCQAAFGQGSFAVADNSIANLPTIDLLEHEVEEEQGSPSSNWFSLSKASSPWERKTFFGKHNLVQGIPANMQFTEEQYKNLNFKFAGEIVCNMGNNYPLIRPEKAVAKGLLPKGSGESSTIFTTVEEKRFLTLNAAPTELIEKGEDKAAGGSSRVMFPDLVIAKSQIEEKLGAVDLSVLWKNHLLAWWGESVLGETEVQVEELKKYLVKTTTSSGTTDPTDVKVSDADKDGWQDLVKEKLKAAALAADTTVDDVKSEKEQAADGKEQTPQQTGPEKDKRGNIRFTLPIMAQLPDVTLPLEDMKLALHRTKRKFSHEDEVEATTADPTTSGTTVTSVGPGRISGKWKRLQKIGGKNKKKGKDKGADAGSSGQHTKKTTGSGKSKNSSSKNKNENYDSKSHEVLQSDEDDDEDDERDFSRDLTTEPLLSDATLDPSYMRLRDAFLMMLVDQSALAPPEHGRLEFARMGLFALYPSVTAAEEEPAEGEEGQSSDEEQITTTKKPKEQAASTSDAAVATLTPDYVCKPSSVYAEDFPLLYDDVTHVSDDRMVDECLSEIFSFPLAKPDDKPKLLKYHVAIDSFPKHGMHNGGGAAMSSSDTSNTNKPILVPNLITLKVRKIQGEIVDWEVPRILLAEKWNSEQLKIQFLGKFAHSIFPAGTLSVGNVRKYFENDHVRLVLRKEMRAKRVSSPGTTGSATGADATSVKVTVEESINGDGYQYLFTEDYLRKIADSQTEEVSVELSVVADAVRVRKASKPPAQTEEQKKEEANKNGSGTATGTTATGVTTPAGGQVSGQNAGDQLMSPRMMNNAGADVNDLSLTPDPRSLSGGTGSIPNPDHKYYLSAIVETFFGVGILAFIFSAVALWRYTKNELAKAKSKRMGGAGSPMNISRSPSATGTGVLGSPYMDHHHNSNTKHLIMSTSNQMQLGDATEGDGFGNAGAGLGEQSVRIPVRLNSASPSNSDTAHSRENSKGATSTSGGPGRMQHTSSTRGSSRASVPIFIPNRLLKNQERSPGSSDRVTGYGTL